MKTITRFLLATLLFAGISGGSFAQTDPAAQALPFTFSAQTGSVLPAGIALHRFGTTAATIPVTRITAPGVADLPYNATANTGGWRDEAGNNGLSMLASGSNAAGAMIIAINTTGQTGIQVQWTVRTILQQASRDNSIALQYRIGTTGNFTDIGTTSTYSSTGKTAGDFASYLEALPAVAENQPVVQLRWLYWESNSTSGGARDRIAVDDVSINPATCTAPSNQPTSLLFTPALTSISGSFTAANPGIVAANGYLVLVAASNVPGAAPASGTAYAIDDVIGNGRVISIGNNLSFTASGLTPSTSYYFFVYAYDTLLSCYNQASPLTAAQATTAPPACTPPANGATGLNATAITGTSMQINYHRGSGDNVMVVASALTPASIAPYNGVSYPVGSQTGNGNNVIYNGPAASFPYTGLTPNTNYYFSVYEYNNNNYCYVSAPLTGNFSTTCTSPIDVSSFSSSAANGAVSLSWNNPSAACFDEVLVVASNAPVTNAGSSFAGAGNPVYTSPGQVIFRGIGTAVSVTGLVNGTTYYFKVFTRNNGVYSTGTQLTATPFDPATGFTYLFGNLHAHSSYSDGNKDDLTKKPKDDYEFARDAECMDFLGISEHNHAGAGMSLPNYALGYSQANQVNGVTGGASGNSIVTLWGMEWGVISGGGHILTYGFDDQLIGWEAGNYNIFCAKNDYNSLFTLINNKPGAFATLAHPNSSDYSGLLATYNPNGDNAVVGTAIESGPAFSTNITYSDFPSSLGYLSYYRNMLAKGYHLGAQMDHDNHNFTFGRTSTDRLVVLAPSKSRQDVMTAMKQMRFYASQDCNVRVDFKLNNNVIGSDLVGAGLPNISLTVIDPDGEAVATAQLWGGQVGGAVAASPIKSNANSSTFTFGNADVENTQPNNSSWYYYFIITQADGNKVVTTPIWYSRNDVILPVTLSDFKGFLNPALHSGVLQWTTEQEVNSLAFVIQRSTDGGRSFSDIAEVAAAGTSNTRKQYTYNDPNLFDGTFIYRLKLLDKDGKYEYSKLVTLKAGKQNAPVYSLYPNPANAFTVLHSTSQASEKLLIQVMDVNGKILRSSTGLLSESSPLRISLQGLQKGYYYTRILNGETGVVKVEKLVIL